MKNVVPCPATADPLSRRSILSFLLSVCRAEFAYDGDGLAKGGDLTL